MGMDKESVGEPVLRPHKKTTQVNIALVVACLVFFAFCLAGLIWLHHRTPGHRGNLTPAEQVRSEQSR